MKRLSSLNQNSNPLTNVPNPTNPQDAATKSYVDSHSGSGGAWGTITGTLSSQSDLQSALDAKSNEADVVHLAGGETITGAKTFATDIYLDDGTNQATINPSGSVSSSTTILQQFASGHYFSVKVAGGADVLTVYDNQIVLSSNSPIVGATFDPTVDDQLSNKHYVDVQVATKQNNITAGTTSQYYRGDKSFQTLDKTAVGLSNVDNTSDATKNAASATLTNKTITAPVISTIVNTGTITLPTTTDTLVGRSTTDTLANKTLTSPTISNYTNAGHTHQGLATGGTLSLALATTGNLSYDRGGTTLTGFTANTFITASTTTALTSTKVIPTGAVVGTTDTQTLSSKRITPRVVSVTSAAPIIPDGNNSDSYTVTALVANATINSPSGTPNDGQKLLLRIKDNGTARTLTWNTVYRAIGVTLPVTTVASKTVYIGCVYNSTDTKWDVIAVSQEA